MDNPEKLVIYVIQETGPRQTEHQNNTTQQTQNKKILFVYFSTD